jgi:hypothetical protein
VFLVERFIAMVPMEVAGQDNDLVVIDFSE